MREFIHVKIHTFALLSGILYTLLLSQTSLFLLSRSLPPSVSLSLSLFRLLIPLLPLSCWFLQEPGLSIPLLFSRSLGFILHPPRALIYMPVIPNLQLYLRFYGCSLDLDSQLPIYHTVFLDSLQALQTQQILCPDHQPALSLTSFF